MLKGINLRKIWPLIFVLVLGLTAGCTTVPIPGSPSLTSDYTKIPTYLVLVFPENVRNCKCSLPWNFIKFNCGASLFETCKDNLGIIFTSVQIVNDIDDAKEPWSSALWVEVDEFNIVKDIGKEAKNSAPKEMQRISLSLTYKITNRDNKVVFSSTLYSEKELFPKASGKITITEQKHAFLKVITDVVRQMGQELQAKGQSGKI